MFTEYKISEAEISERSIHVVQGIQSASPGENPARFAAGVIGGRLAQSPARYREFGPYWWAVKAALAALGRPQGPADDVVLRAEYGGGLQPFAALVAGEIFAEFYRLTWLVGNALFWLSPEGGAPYALVDQDMEARAAGLPGTPMSEVEADDGTAVLDSVAVVGPLAPFRVEFVHGLDVWTADLYAADASEAEQRAISLGECGKLDAAIGLARAAGGEPVIDNSAGIPLHVDLAKRHAFEVCRPTS